MIQNIQSTECCQIQDPDMMWPKRRKSDLVVRPGGNQRQNLTQKAEQLQQHLLSKKSQKSLLSMGSILFPNCPIAQFQCKTGWDLTFKRGPEHNVKLPNFSAIRDGALHAKEGSKGSRGACPNQCTYQDYQVEDGW